MYSIIKKRGSVLYLSLSIFYEDQNEEYPLTKIEQFSIVLEKLAVNVEVRKK